MENAESKYNKTNSRNVFYLVIRDDLSHRSLYFSNARMHLRVEKLSFWEHIEEK